MSGAPKTGGAWLKQQSRFYHTDGQWSLDKYIHWAQMLLGADARVYEVIPDGNNFVDFSRPLAERTTPGGKNQYYSKFGGFVQVTKLFFDEKLKLNGSFRLDYNTEFEVKPNPRIAAVYSAAKHHNFRASYQNGWRFPALFEALSFVNNGNVRRVGGLPKVNEGLGDLENSYTLTSIDNFLAAINADVAGGLTQNDAALKNRSTLAIANLPEIQPEHINAFDIGYRSVLADNKLAIDWEACYNIYGGFLGQVEVAVPKTDQVGTDASVLDMLTRSKQDRYRVFTNARNVGFNVVCRWQYTFVWESPLANGIVPVYNTIDAQVNLRVPDLHTTIKIGGANLLNTRYIQYVAGPTLGGLYYVAVTYDGTVIR